MPTYDDIRFSPAAPVLRATLRNPENKAVLADVLMLIDSGADITLLPEAQWHRWVSSAQAPAMS